MTERSHASAPPLGGSSDLVRAGEVVAGKYVVKSVIGRGGVGIVVAAHHTTLQVPVALKFLRPEHAHDPEIAARFLREARAAAKLTSAHVARVMDAGTTDDGAAFLAMELLEGRDFAAILKAEGSLPITDAVDYIMQACDAVAEAHALGIVHRDLKSANLFLTRSADGMPLVKVLDFGLSKVESAESRDGLTSQDHVFGSLHFMSPEQMRSSRDADARSDIWSLGVILYAFVAGRLPFAGQFLNEVCAAVLTSAPPSVISLRPDVPAGLDAAILRCLRVEPSERFQSVAELVRALAPFAPARGASHLARIERFDAQRPSGAASALPSEPQVAPAPTTPMLAAERPARSPVRALVALVAIVALAGAVTVTLLLVATRGAGDPPAAPQASIAAAVPPAASLVAAPPPSDREAVRNPADARSSLPQTPSASRPARPPSAPMSAPLPRRTKTDEDLIMRLPH